MIPILYKANTTSFNNAGLGNLDRIIDCKVTENLNGTFELNMQLLRDDALINSVEVGAIICAKPNQTQGSQPFVIEQINKGIDGILEIYATHIGQYRAKLIPILPFTANSLQESLESINTYVTEDNPFTFYTNKSVNTPFTIEKPRSLRDLLGGTEGSILDVYGGEYLFDNFNVYLFTKRGRENTNIKIMYGENMTEYMQQDSFSYTKSITGILPYYSKKDGQSTTTVIGDTQYSQYVDYYTYHKTIPYDFTDKFPDTVPTKAQLNTLAQQYINNKGLPQVNIEASFEDITTLPQYNMLLDQVKVLQLGDYVNVINNEYGTNITTRIRQLVYDVLLERYSTISIGDEAQTINDAISNTASNVTNNYNTSTSYIGGVGIDISSDVITNKFAVLTSVDLNDINYHYMGYIDSATGNTPTSTTSGYLIVVVAEGLDRCFQIWKSRTSNNIYHRYYINSAWSTWVQLQNVS